MAAAAQGRGIRKGIRTILQVIAAGGLTSVVTLMAGGLSPAVSGIVLGLFTAFVAYLQNTLETAGKIPVLLPSPGLVQKVGSTVATGIVEAVTQPGGNVVGTVTDLAGGIVGSVVGELDDASDAEAAATLPGIVVGNVDTVTDLAGGVIGSVVGDEEER